MNEKKEKDNMLFYLEFEGAALAAARESGMLPKAEDGSEMAIFRRFMNDLKRHMRKAEFDLELAYKKATTDAVIRWDMQKARDRELMLREQISEPAADVAKVLNEKSDENTDEDKKQIPKHVFSISLSFHKTDKNRYVLKSVL